MRSDPVDVMVMITRAARSAVAPRPTSRHFETAYSIARVAGAP